MSTSGVVTSHLMTKDIVPTVVLRLRATSYSSHCSNPFLERPPLMSHVVSRALTFASGIPHASTCDTTTMNVYQHTPRSSWTYIRSAMSVPVRSIVATNASPLVLCNHPKTKTNHVLLLPRHSTHCHLILFATRHLLLPVLVSTNVLQIFPLPIYLDLHSDKFYRCHDSRREKG